MRFAVIDLGTNTFNLLIGAKTDECHYNKLFNTKISVKLGEGCINEGFIADIPFQRGINALKQYQQYLQEYEVADTNVYAFATSAIRSASNGIDFIIETKNITGINITIINGDEEASLIYYGIKAAVTLTDKTALIFDIGGGSNELILANDTTIFWKQSFLLGAARLLYKFNPSNPIKSSEIENIYSYLKVEFAPLLAAIKQFPTTELIGSSGAFDSVIDMIAGKYGTIATNDEQTEYEIYLEKYQMIYDLIISSTIQQRQHIKGLIEMRIDMIVISCLLVNFIIKECGITVFKASSYSLKEGVIFKKLGLIEVKTLTK